MIIDHCWSENHLEQSIEFPIILQLLEETQQYGLSSSVLPGDMCETVILSEELQQN